MKTLKELLKRDKHIWLFIENKHKKAFLQFALDNGCTWLDGSEINVKNDSCGKFMAITKDNKIGFIAIQCWTMKGKNPARKIIFSNVLGEDYE